MKAFSAKGLSAPAIALVFVAPAPAFAQNTAAAGIDVPAGAMDAALIQLGRQTGLQILFVWIGVEKGPR